MLLFDTIFIKILKLYVINIILLKYIFKTIVYIMGRKLGEEDDFITVPGYGLKRRDLRHWWNNVAQERFWN